MYSLLPENAIRQLIDSQAIFREFRRSREAAQKFAGGMYFKKEGAYEYLVRTTPKNKQSRIGPRNAATEQQYAAFNEGKAKAESRLQALKLALQDATRMNKALRVGRVPTLVVDVLNALDSAGLADYFTVIGTHALYAYETAAGIIINSGALATQDVDLLWDARRLVQFQSSLNPADNSILRILKKADPSFERMDDQKESVINEKGFMVDFLRRVARDGDPHPFRFSADEDDLWPVQAERAEAFLNQPRLSQVVVAANGTMAEMHTTAPTVFVEFKRWMSTLESRSPLKRRRDLLQANLVEQLIKEHLLINQGQPTKLPPL